MLDCGHILFLQGIYGGGTLCMGNLQILPRGFGMHTQTVIFGERQPKNMVLAVLLTRLLDPWPKPASRMIIGIASTLY